MMARKLAGFLSILGLLALFGAWLFRTWQGKSTVSVDQAVSAGFTILIAYFVVGVFVAKVGIGLVQEVIAERRHREEDPGRLVRVLQPVHGPEAMRAVAGWVLRGERPEQVRRRGLRVVQRHGAIVLQVVAEA